MKVIPDTRPFKLINTPSLIYICFKSGTSVQKLFPLTYNLMCVVFSGNSGSLHQYNYPPRYN